MAGLVETKILASTAMIFGTVSFVLFVAPFFLYAAKIKDKQSRNDGPLKIIGEVSFLHLAMVIIAVIMTGALNGIMIKPEFKPENGLLYFYGLLSGGSLSPWEYWLTKELGVSTIASARDAEFMKAFILSMQYYMLFIFMAYAFIPILILWNTFASLTSPNDFENAMGSHGGGRYYQDYLNVARNAFVKFFFVTFIVLFHMSLASLYISIFVDGISHYALMSTLWNSILFN